MPKRLPAEVLLIFNRIPVVQVAVKLACIVDTREMSETTDELSACQMITLSTIQWLMVNPEDLCMVRAHYDANGMGDMQSSYAENSL